ncbi:hypothetical protein E4U54_006768, partial [Claviceps lovelessii]
MSGTQNFINNGTEAMHFTSNHWESGNASSIDNEAVMQRTYAIQRFSKHPDDPYVASGTIPASNPLGNQQAPCAPNLQILQPMDFPQSLVPRLSEHAANYVDSGYGGSHLSCSASSPSARTEKTEETQSLKCMHCNHEAKNKAEMRSDYPPRMPTKPGRWGEVFLANMHCFRKHINRHNKPHKCGFHNCTKGFATQNDLDRHKRTVHRKEYLGKGNMILYECLHCKDQRGKLNTRKKTEWPRKDNFLAHLDRMHHIRYRPSDNLDQYVIRLQHGPGNSIEYVTGKSDQAQHFALQGIGTGADADFNGPHFRSELAHEMPPADQTNDAYQTQRLSMFMYRKSHVLTNASLLEPSTQGEFVSQGMLNSPEYDLDDMGRSLRMAQDDERLQQSLGQTPVQSGHHANSGGASSLIIPWRVPNQSDNEVRECHENEEIVPYEAQDSNSTANVTAMTSQNRPDCTATSLYTTSNGDSTLTLDGTVQPCPQWIEFEEILRLLRQIPRETLQAALDSRGPESDEGYAAKTHAASNSSQHLCPTCQKTFKRQCQL